MSFWESLRFWIALPIAVLIVICAFWLVFWAVTKVVDWTHRDLGGK